jgi:cellulose synthase/poly-beta-1,6-N-acetylglucosamine synthase-like glycosyltransferase
MKYSFIIPVKEINDYIRESIPKILEINREDYEIIIYPDIVNNESWPKTRQIVTGKVGPAQKRNLALRDAQGDFLVFIDDDAYPEKNILDVLDIDFQDEKISAVGGPAITPRKDSFLQKVSGAFFLSSFSGGFPERYVPKGKKKEIDDWPTVNLTVRKNIFQKINGFNSEYWPGEDTELCLQIIKNGGKIIYDPQVQVWHHRREGLLRHLRQVGGYGIHRGFFAKKYPETSFKLIYFIPSIFFIFTLLFPLILILYLLNPYAFDWIFGLFLLGWCLYFFALSISFFQILYYEKNVLVSLYALVYIFLGHIYYGLRFIKGFVFTKELKSKLR